MYHTAVRAHPHCNGRKSVPLAQSRICSTLPSSKTAYLICKASTTDDIYEEVDPENVQVELLEPEPVTDQNIDALEDDDEDAFDVRKREEEAWTRREGYLSYFFGDKQDREILIKQVPERLLDLGEVVILDHEKDTHYEPKMTGEIERQPLNYQVIPVETFVSGEVFDGIEEKHLLNHLLLVKVLSEDPHTLDFGHVLCFNCSNEEFYRVGPTPIRDPETISEPVLRFLPQDNFFIIDDKATMPNPYQVNIKHEADDLGANYDLDLYSGLDPPKALPGSRKRSSDGEDYDEEDYSSGSGEEEDPADEPAAAPKSDDKKRKKGISAPDLAKELASAAQEASESSTALSSGEASADTTAVRAAVAEEESVSEETSKMTTGAEFDTSDTPDVPAVDLA